MNSIRNRNRTLLVVIAALFIVPLLLAVLMQSRWWGYEPDSTTNRGRLVQPPVPLSLERALVLHPDAVGTEDVSGRWAMLYVAVSPCAATCLEDIAGLRQVYLASGRDQQRLSMMIVTDPSVGHEERAALGRIHSGLVLLGDPGGTLHDALEAAVAGELEIGGWAFVIDPPGNIILAYAKGFAPADVKQDLERLLKWSAQDGTP